MFPQLLKFGDFWLPTYGFLVTAGFLVGLWVTARLARREGVNAELVINLGVYCALAGIAGAKLLLFVFDWEYYARHPGEILSLSTLQAGGVFQGGLVFALATGLFYLRKQKMSFLATADLFAPGIALGHALGRVGCFSAGCCWGQQCDRPWAVTFTSSLAHERFGTPLHVPLHPTQLYEALAEAVVFVILYLRYSPARRRGSLIGLYLILYSTVRFAVEFVRAHDQPNPFGGPLSTTQWIALALAGAGVWLLARRAAPGTSSGVAAP